MMQKNKQMEDNLCHFMKYVQKLYSHLQLQKYIYVYIFVYTIVG